MLLSGMCPTLLHIAPANMQLRMCMAPAHLGCTVPHHHSCVFLQMIQHKENPALCSFFIFYRWGEHLQATKSTLLA